MGGERTADGRRKAGSAERVRGFVAARGLDERLVVFEQSTKTARMAADAVGCELGQIVKSLALVTDRGPLLALVAGDRRGDLDAIGALAGVAPARMADAEEVRAATGYSIGGVSPFDLPEGLDVLVDDSLERYETVYPAGGTPNAVVRLSVGELLDLSGGRMARISHEA